MGIDDVVGGGNRGRAIREPLCALGHDILLHVDR